jgi:hypothetical protein
VRLRLGLIRALHVGQPSERDRDAPLDQLLNLALTPRECCVSDPGADAGAAPGQRRQQLLWHGRQAGRVCLRERKLGVSKPRLWEKGGGELAISAYEAMQENGLSERCWMC